MDIMIVVLMMAAGLLIVYSLSPQWIRWGVARQMAWAEGLEAQRQQRGRSLMKWNAELGVKPLIPSKLVELPSRSLGE